MENPGSAFGAEAYDGEIRRTLLELFRECGFETAELLWASYLQAGVLGIKS